VASLILIADDDDQILDTVGFLLEESGYRTCVANNKQAMFAEIETKNPDLIFLDVELGADNGFEIALDIRKTSNTPIIMLTGKSSETDRVVGLELGADDYITKPFSTAELLARIKAVLRRSRIAATQNEAAPKDIARFDNWQCDTKRRTLTTPEGTTVKLSSGEFSLLLALLKSDGRAMSREHLLDVTGKDDSFDRSIDIQIMRLRRKLSDVQTDEQFIQSVRSVGYIFTPKVTWS